jgi:DNA-directed RNA polymerase specialized sigma54-like protein
MLTDLSYVRGKLERMKPPELQRIADEIDVHVKTLKRFVRRESYPRSDTIGKLAIYFRTKDKRGR